MNASFSYLHRSCFWHDGLFKSCWSKRFHSTQAASWPCPNQPQSDGEVLGQRFAEKSSSEYAINLGARLFKRTSQGVAVGPQWRVYHQPVSAKFLKKMLLFVHSLTYPTQNCQDLWKRAYHGQRWKCSWRITGDDEAWFVFLLYFISDSCFAGSFCNFLLRKSVRWPKCWIQDVWWLW